MIPISTCDTGGMSIHPLTADGTLETMLAKMSSEIPFPTPRWVISSPSHISSVVPAVIDRTIR